MSWWTEVLLTATVVEDVSGEEETPRFPAVDHINSWLCKNGWWDLFLIQPPNQHQHGPEASFAGNFKSLDKSGFVEAVRTAPWEWREQVQLFVREEDDRGFQEIKLWENRVTSPSTATATASTPDSGPRPSAEKPHGPLIYTVVA